MALLDKTTLQKSAGLLNATAPEDHFLAYITEGERDMLVQAGGKETPTASGINAYPPGMGDPAYAGAEGVDAPAGGASAGGDYGGNVNPSQTYAGHTVQEQRDYRADPEGYVAKHAGDVKPEDTSWFDGVKDYILSGGMIGMAINLTGEVLSKLGEYSSELQKKAMTMSLNSRVKSKMKDLDLNNPNSMNNPEIADLHKDLADIEAGTFTQTDFTEKYGSGDLGGGGNGGDRELMNTFVPYAAHAVGGTTQEPSMAAQWYSNLGGNQGGFDLTTAYASAKAKVSQTLGQPTAIGQLAVNESPFFNFLKENSLNKGIL